MISLKFLPNGQINIISELVQIMAWRRRGDKPLSEPMMDKLLTHICVTRPQWVWRHMYHQTSNISHTLVGNEIVDHSDVVGASPVGAAPHDDVIKWKHFPRYWPFVQGIHRPPVHSPHKCQWRGALMFSLIRAWINAWVNHCEAGDLRRHRAHYDVIVMSYIDIFILDYLVSMDWEKTTARRDEKHSCFGIWYAIY